MKKGLKDLTVEEKKAFYIDLVKSLRKESLKVVAGRWNLKMGSAKGAVERLRSKGIDVPKRKGGAYHGRYLKGNFLRKLRTIWVNDAI